MAARVPLNQQEFDKIKEMQGRGEIMEDIMKATDRSNGVVTNAMQVQTLDEYFELGRKNYHKWKEGQKQRALEQERAHSVQVTTLQPKTAYGRLRQLRDHLDQTLIDVVVEEVNALQADTIEENRQLQRENQELREQLEGSSDRFINSLKKVVHSEPKIVERKTLLPLFLTRNKRVAYRLSDVQETLSDEEWKDFSDFIKNEEKGDTFLSENGEAIIPVSVVEKWMSHEVHTIDLNRKQETPTVSPALV